MRRIIIGAIATIIVVVLAFTYQMSVSGSSKGGDHGTETGTTACAPKTGSSTNATCGPVEHEPKPGERTSEEAPGVDR